MTLAVAADKRSSIGWTGHVTVCSPTGGVTRPLIRACLDNGKSVGVYTWTGWEWALEQCAEGGRGYGDRPRGAWAFRVIGSDGGRARVLDDRIAWRPVDRRRSAVSIYVAVLIVVGATAVAIVAMLLVRRRAPDGSYFNDGDRAAGIFGVLATGFAVLLGFVVFLAFTSYDAARSGAEMEAQLVAQQVETTQLLPADSVDELTGGLVCYARSVAGVQWRRMEDGTLGEDLNPWAVSLARTFEQVDPQTASEQAAYSKYLDQRSDREVARNDRTHGAVGVIPLPLWIVLFFIAGLIFVYILFFADSGERAVVQALLMGSVVAVIVSTLLLLQFLDNPFHRGIGGLRPVAMERTLTVINQEVRAAGHTVHAPCDAEGNPL